MHPIVSIPLVGAPTTAGAQATAGAPAPAIVTMPARAALRSVLRRPREVNKPGQDTYWTWNSPTGSLSIRETATGAVIVRPRSPGESDCAPDTHRIANRNTDGCAFLAIPLPSTPAQFVELLASIVAVHDVRVNALTVADVAQRAAVESVKAIKARSVKLIGHLTIIVDALIDPTGSVLDPIGAYVDSGALVKIATELQGAVIPASLTTALDALQGDKLRANVARAAQQAIEALTPVTLPALVDVDAVINALENADSLPVGATFSMILPATRDPMDEDESGAIDLDDEATAQILAEAGIVADSAPVDEDVDTLTASDVESALPELTMGSAVKAGNRNRNR